MLPERERVCARGRVEVALRLDDGGPGLVVPAPELREVDARGIGHGRHEIVRGDRLPVVAREVQVHAAPERIRADERVDHAHHFGAFLVHGGGVEVGDLHVRLRPHRVRHRPGVLGELGGAQAAHLLDALHRARIHVGAEFLVAEDREAFFQRELKPVAARDAVAGPVVEIFVGHDAVDVVEIGVGRGVGAGQHVLRVEDVEALVLHRAHVEVADRDDHVVVEVHLQAEHVLVPLHALLERLHGEGALVELAGLDEDGECHRASRPRDEAVFELVELRGNEREEVRRLRERVFPPGPMPSAMRGAQQVDAGPAVFRRGGLHARGRVHLVAAPDSIAVRQQDRKAVVVGADRRRVARHHVGPVDHVRDAPEAFRLALGEESVLRSEKAHQRRVVPRADAHSGVERERVGHVGDGQMRIVERVLARVERPAIERHRLQRQPFAVEHERRGSSGGGAIAANRQSRAHVRVIVANVEVELDRVHQKRRRLVVLEVDGLGGGFAHGSVPVTRAAE